MLDFVTNNALLDMLPADPMIDKDAEAKLAQMDDKAMHHLITYNPSLVWILDNFELRRPGPPSVNLSSFERHPCQDPHWMRADLFESRLSHCRSNTSISDSTYWPHKLIWGQWLAVARSRGHLEAMSENYPSLFVPEHSCWEAFKQMLTTCEPMKTDLA